MSRRRLLGLNEKKSPNLSHSILRSLDPAAALDGRKHSHIHSAYKGKEAAAANRSNGAVGMYFLHSLFPLTATTGKCFLFHASIV